MERREGPRVDVEMKRFGGSNSLAGYRFMGRGRLEKDWDPGFLKKLTVYVRRKGEDWDFFILKIEGESCWNVMFLLVVIGLNFGKGILLVERVLMRVDEGIVLNRM